MTSKNPFISKQWPGKLFPKIDVYYKGQYAHSTNACESCQLACQAAAFEMDTHIKHFRANYQHDRKGKISA